MVQLDSICQIFNGYSFRGKIVHQPDGDTHVVQMKNLLDEYTAIDPGMVMVKGEVIRDKYTLESGDVLFISKGANNHAITYDLELPRAVASAIFFVLRLNKKIAFNPYYLAWYINQVPAQQYISSRMAGTHIPNVNVDTIRSLPIQLPSLRTQDSIAAIYRLHHTEQVLQKEIAENRSTLIRTLLKPSIDTRTSL